MPSPIALITGSRMGIGRATAEVFARQGYTVILNARNASKLEQARAEMAAEGLSVGAYACDVANWASVEGLMAFIQKTYGRLDVLINNAGVATRGSLANLGPEVFRQVIDVNILGNVFPTKAALPLLKASQGSVICIGSIAGLHGIPYNSAYSASKMALQAFTEAIRIEHRADGIHVGLLYVGFTENDPKKVVYDADGREMYLPQRDGIKQMPTSQVAEAVLQLVRSRRKKRILTAAGKALGLFQRLWPGLIDFIYRRNLGTIRANSEGEAEYVPKE